MSIKLSTTNQLVVSCAIMALFLLLRCMNDIFIIPAALFGVGSMFFLNKKNCFPFLLFLLPIANIFKFAPEQLSIYTVLFFIYIFKFSCSRKFSLKFLSSGVFFLAFMILVSGLSQIKDIISIFCGCLMIYEVSTSDSKYSLKDSLYAFSYGFIIASIIAVLRDNLPILQEFIEVSSMRLSEDNHIDRFSGLQGNPNYYTLDSSIILACLAVRLVKESKSYRDVLLFLIISGFSLYSVSKSFLFSWVLLLLILLFEAIKSGGRKFLIVLGSLLAIAAGVFYFAHDALDLYLSRFVLDENNGDMSNITTGRTDIWKMYFEKIFGSMRIFLLGNGIGGDLVAERGAHNTYIEILYSLGIIGSTILFSFLRQAMSISIKIRKEFVLFIPFFILLFRFIAIGTLTYDNVPFYLALSCLLYRYYKRDNDYEKFTTNLR